MTDNTANLQTINRDELAELLGRSRATIDRWRRHGKLPAEMKVGAGHVCWFLHDIRDWLQGSRVDRSAAA